MTLEKYCSKLLPTGFMNYFKTQPQKPTLSEELKFLRGEGLKDKADETIDRYRTNSLVQKVISGEAEFQDIIDELKGKKLQRESPAKYNELRKSLEEIFPESTIRVLTDKHYIGKNMLKGACIGGVIGAVGAYMLAPYFGQSATIPGVFATLITTLGFLGYAENKEGKAAADVELTQLSFMSYCINKNFKKAEESVERLGELDERTGELNVRREERLKKTEENIEKLKNTAELLNRQIDRVKKISKDPNIQQFPFQQLDEGLTALEKAGPAIEEFMRKKRQT